ncbi:hypothetical protein AXG93_4225s1520 [Marchantia polymorpha subsp. ruderalis]|uniref:Uncharacterized protein n=1 Tax=Marchantia polymorpha subsp. ruderalis TaxID=1480154 RepID=A0A176WRU4_MARPO|nr:hypothetical protein AXG93_4225s1520 [Marchantia polymorpha subsp. ruderalis]
MASLTSLLGQGQLASLQILGGSRATTAVGQSSRSRVVVMSASPCIKQRDVEPETSGRRTMLMSTLLMAGSLLAVGQSEAAMQKIEGGKRETQEAFTRGITEPSNLSAAKSNTIQESARSNAQASGGVILGAAKDTPRGAYRTSQTTDEKTSEPGVTKMSQPENLLKKRAEAAGQ